MQQWDVGSVPIVDDGGRLIGLCTDRDIVVRLLALNLSPQTAVSDIMSTDLHTAQPDDDLEFIEQLMERFQVRRVPIVNDQNVLVGFISTADLARHAPRDIEEHEVAAVFESVSQLKY